jgi:hypothetical protein
MADDTSRNVATLALIGAAVGLGQLMASAEKLTLRIVIGRALSSVGLAVSAATVLVWLPDLSIYAQCGIAALIASLGTSGLERILQRVIKK